MHNSLLNNIAQDIVLEKVIEDKVKEMAKEKEEKENTEKYKIEGEDDLVDLDEVDSEEERIMQKELQKRQDKAEMMTDKQEITLSKKYGEYREIAEEEFLDTLLKNENVVCHFYHNDFERCKIIDKHLKIISHEHPETLFVRINADKTPFFTTKLGVRVSLTTNQ
jgi:hypothetical protein